MELSAEAGRVVGSLVEKQLTTPDQYPLTLKALVAACNQSSNRDPVVSYDEHTVMSTLNWLKEQRLVRFVLPSHGRSAVRYRHVLDEALGLDQRQCALLAVLLLRGPQTVGELRARTDRMTEFDGLDEVEHELQFLSSVEEPLAVSLGRRPGQKEERWICPLLISSWVERSSSDPFTAGPGVEHDTEQIGSRSVGFGPNRLDELTSDLDSLRSEVSELRRDLDALRASLGG
jgi:uncharacterized protein YceH (UPF0502 family)